MSINGILKVVIAAFGIVLMAVLCQGAWISWNALVSANAISSVASASSNMFVALTSVRLEGAATKAALKAEGVASLPAFAVSARQRELEFLPLAINDLKQIDFPSRDQTVATLSQTLQRLKDMQLQTERAIALPRASRPVGLEAEFSALNSATMSVLTEIAAKIQPLVQLRDPQVDLLINLHKTAWALRAQAGNALSNITENITVRGDIPADAVLLQANAFGSIDTMWSTIESQVGPLAQLPTIREAMASAKSQYFASEFRAHQIASLKKLMAGEKLDFDRAQWDTLTVSKLSPLANVAASFIDAAKASAAKAADDAQFNLIVRIVMLVAALGAVVLLLRLVSVRVIRPIETLTLGMSAIADGALDTEIAGADRRDEIGRMAVTVAVFRDGLRRNRELEEQSACDRTMAERSRKELMTDLAAQFEKSVGGIITAVTDSARGLEQAASALNHTANETSHRSTSVASAAEEASANVASVASSAEELSASVQEISRQVHQSEEISAAAVAEAHATAGVVGELSQAAGRISAVLELISNIAGQTNLLALNATIEAARAGEAGRGFAVVAAEVKELANQTAKATADISAQITSIQNSTERAVGAIGSIAETIGSMNKVASTISESVSMQGSATTEIVHAIGQANQGTGEVTDNITMVAEAVRKSGVAAGEVLSASGVLAQQAAQMRKEVDAFLGTIRSA